MKKFILVVIVGMMCTVFSTLATEQVPDLIEFDGKELALHTGWGHPSPMVAYFSQNNIEYPFQSSSTANYRGHIAHWKIHKNRLFLKKVIAHKGKKPNEYGIESNGDSVKYKSYVFADWFSGIIECVEENPENRWSEPISQYLIWVRYGNVIDYQRYTPKDTEEMQKLYEAGNIDDITDEDMKKKFMLSYMYNNYISFYFRMNVNDSLNYEGKSGVLISNLPIPYFLKDYTQDFLKCKYNWEQEISGVPSGIWEIKEKKIFLKNVRLVSGLGFYRKIYHAIEIQDVLPEYEGMGDVFGNWMNGDFMIKIGKEVEDKYVPGTTKFHTERVIFVTIEDGVIVNELEFDLEQKINWRDLPKDWSPEMRGMVEKFSTHLYNVQSKF